MSNLSFQSSASSSLRRGFAGGRLLGTDSRSDLDSVLAVVHSCHVHTEESGNYSVQGQHQQRLTNKN